MKRSRSSFFPLVLLFVLAVLVPSIALSFLALRAAERESLYVERRLEGALLAEADLAAGRIAELMTDLAAELQKEAENAFADPGSALVEVSFSLRNGDLELSEAPAAAKENFMSSFGVFLLGEARLPAYDSIVRVYRKEMQPLPEEDKADGASYETFSESRRTFAPSDPLPEEQEAPRIAATLSAPRVRQEPPAPAMPSKSKKAPSGIERQMAESSIAADSEVREEAFKQASAKGFDILLRNVLPQNLQSPAAAVPDERSKTVSRGRTFGELLNESDGGLMPRLSDRGLELLFWSVRADGSVAGCSIRMETVRERIADVIPLVFSEARILTILDDTGEPLVVPPELPPSGTPDWRRPFVAREISPLLPRWEVGVWLADPGAITSRARSAELAVWMLVAILVVVIAAGGAVVLRVLSSEMRLARQKTTFVANVSHELKTPLTSIRLFAELLLSGKQTDGERREGYLRTIVAETGRLSRLIDNVLAFSKRGRESYSMQRLSLAELTRETLEQLEPHLVKNGFRIVLEQEGEPFVRGDREALRQVIMNLLSNAEKYSGESREISVRCRSEDGWAVTEIADRGVGVESRFADKIFQEFFRIDDSLSALRNGAGLGLSIARDIARRHGGDIAYSPRSGGGSRFSLRLPAWKGGNE